MSLPPYPLRDNRCQSGYNYIYSRSHLPWGKGESEPLPWAMARQFLVLGLLAKVAARKLTFNSCYIAYSLLKIKISTSLGQSCLSSRPRPL